MTLAALFCPDLLHTGTNYESAIRTLFGRFKEQWEANSAAIVGYVPDVQWQGVEKDTPTDNDQFFVRVSNKTIDERPTSLRGSEGTRYETIGDLNCELYCPKTEDGITKGRQLAALARDIFKGKRLSEIVSIIKTELREVDNAREKYYLFLTITRYRYYEIT